MKKYHLTVYISNSNKTHKQVQFEGNYWYQWMAVIAAWWNTRGIEDLINSGIVHVETVIVRINGEQQRAGDQSLDTKQV